MSVSQVSTVRPASPDAATLAHLSDEVLLLMLRMGDQGAFGELYLRHVGDSRRLAARLVPANDVDDLVAEAFAKVLHAILRGYGPTETPIRYIMVAIRNTAFSLRTSRAVPADLDAEPDRLTSVEDELPGFEDELLLAAFRSLSPRWRKVIWWAEIEDRAPSEIGDLIGLSPSAASALAYRARRALRDAYRAAQALANPERPRPTVLARHLQR